jgi:ABC-type nitrate/sulfonate/bicarbonate transport system substrate-binding protein
MKNWGRPTKLIGALAFLTVVVAEPARADPVRLGWQVPWATQGQFVMALAHTNIPRLIETDITPVGFAYGEPLNAAAVAGQLDVLLTADQPAIVLLALRPKYRIVARMVYNRARIYVPRKAPTVSLKDLAGRTVMGPVGAAAERVSIRALRDAGVDLATIHFGSLDMAQQASVISRPGGDSNWAGVDALYGFDPLVAMFEDAGRVRILSCGNIVSMVLASEQMLGERRAELERFLAGFTLAWYYYAQNSHTLNSLFATQARLNVDDAVLDRSAAVEPNRSGRSIDALRLTFSKEDISALVEVEQFLRDQRSIPGPVDVEHAVDLRPLQAALARADLAELAAKIELVPNGGR